MHAGQVAGDVTAADGERSDRSDEDGGLSEQQLRAGLRTALNQGLAGHAMGTLAGGVFLTKVVLDLGASLYVIGLLAAIPAFAQLASVGGTYLVETYRTRKPIALLGLGGVRVCILCIAGIPLLLAGRRDVALSLVLTFVGLQGVFGAAGGSAWNSLLRDLVPQEQMGAFFSRRQRLSLLLGVPLSLLAAAFVNRWPARFPEAELAGYSILFVAGCGAGLVGLYYLWRTPEPPMPPPEPRTDFLALLARPFRDRNFRRLIAFLGSWHLAISLSAPFFTVYLLERLGYPMAWVVGLGVLSQLSNAAFAPIWGRLSDAYSNKAVLGVGGPLVLAGTALWLFTGNPAPHGLTLVVLVAVHALLGISMSGVTLATGNIGMKLAPRGRGTAYLTAIGLVGSLTAGVGPLLGGAIAGAFASHRLLLTLSWEAPAGGFSIPAIYLQGIDFAFLMAILVGVYSLHRLSLVEEDGRGAPPEVADHLLAEVRRPFLSFTTVGGFAHFVALSIPHALPRRRRRRSGSGSDRERRDRRERREGRSGGADDERGEDAGT
jgi:MFS family permease